MLSINHDDMVVASHFREYQSYASMQTKWNGRLQEIANNCLTETCRLNKVVTGRGDNCKGLILLPFKINRKNLRTISLLTSDAVTTIEPEVEAFRIEIIIGVLQDREEPKQSSKCNKSSIKLTSGSDSDSDSDSEEKEEIREESCNDKNSDEVVFLDENPDTSSGPFFTFSIADKKEFWS